MTTLVPKYDQGATGAVNRNFNLKLSETVSVLDFGADSTGTTDSTTAFNNAIATGKRVYVPNGTYSVSNIAVVDNMVIEGESRAATILTVNTNNTAVFYTSAIAGGISRVTNIRFSNFTMTAKAGVTGARGYNQPGRTNYTSYSFFTNIESTLALEFTYLGFFIFTVWEQCRDGYLGPAPGAQTHQAINSFPDAYGQTLQTNLCQVNNCQFFGATDANGAITIAYGNNWTFNSCDFELCATKALDIRGVYGVAIQNGWFENCDAASVIETSNTGAPNAQGTRPVDISNCYVAFHANNTSFVNSTGNDSLSVRSVAFTACPTGCKLTNLTTLDALYGIVELSGDFSSFLTGIITTPSDVSNQNIMPIGPTGLGQANFTNNGFTAKADVASGIGLAASAVQFTLSNAGNAVYYTMPAKLVTFLQGKAITLVATGYTSGGGAELFKAAVWDSVATPAFSNYTASATTPNAIDVSVAAGTVVQTTSVNYTVTAASTSLKIGFWCGGNANAQTVAIESMRLVLGTQDPLISGLV